jgi:hypothetical protein
MRHALARRTALVAVLVAAAAGCSGAPADPKAAPAVLVTQPDFRPGATAACLMHQTEQPSTVYEGGPDAHRRRS